jgi:hypothetical protein
VANVSASFDSTAAAEVQVSAPLTSSSGISTSFSLPLLAQCSADQHWDWLWWAAADLGVSSQFARLDMGNTTLPASALTSTCSLFTHRTHTTHTTRTPHNS